MEIAVGIVVLSSLMIGCLLCGFYYGASAGINRGYEMLRGKPLPGAPATFDFLLGKPDPMPKEFRHPPTTAVLVSLKVLADATRREATTEADVARADAYDTAVVLVGSAILGVEEVEALIASAQKTCEAGDADAHD